MKNAFKIFVNFCAHFLGAALLAGSIYFGVTHKASQVVGGIVHPPSLIVVATGLLGIALASYRVEVLLILLKHILFLSPSTIRIRYTKIQEMLPELTDIYYEKGPAVLLQEVEKRKLGKFWIYIVSKLEARMPIHDVQMFAQSLGRSKNEDLFIHIRILQSLATVAPAVGMTGTILGLIKLLKDLNQFETLGSNMALAFITALYGLVFGNFIFIPLANRMNAAREEMMNLFSQILFWLDMVAKRKPATYLDQDEIARLAG